VYKVGADDAAALDRQPPGGALDLWEEGGVEEPEIWDKVASWKGLTEFNVAKERQVAKDYATQIIAVITDEIEEENQLLRGADPGGAGGRAPLWRPPPAYCC
jgi:hypothetical protein